MRAFTALTRSRGHVRELGASPAHTEHQYRRAERQHRRAELAAARARAPGFLATAVGVGVLFGLVDGVPLALEGCGALAGFLLIVALLPDPKHRRLWQHWREHRRQLARSLRGLGDGWTILWDRRLQAAPTPGHDCGRRHRHLDPLAPRTWSCDCVRGIAIASSAPRPRAWAARMRFRAALPRRSA